MAEKILIVDDDIDSLKLIGLMLQRHGYEVIAISAGEQTFSKATSEHPDLIILDVMMPEMDGYEVTQQLRADDRTRDIPIIMFTAKTLIDDKVKAFELGADDYLTKPTHPAELASRVKSILARKSTQKNKASDQAGQVIGVLGVKGGVGTTTIAANIAAALTTDNTQPIIADFCLGAGALGLILGQDQVSSMPMLLTRQPNEIDKERVSEQLVKHKSGMQLLLTSTRPKEALLNYAPETALEIVKTLRHMSAHVVLDLGNHMSAAVSLIAREVDQLLVVVEPNRIALNMTRELFQALEADEVKREVLNVAVMNRTQSNLQMPWQEIEQTLGLDIKAIISAAPDLAYQAVEANTPIVLFRPNAITASQLTKLAKSLQTQTKTG